MKQKYLVYAIVGIGLWMAIVTFRNFYKNEPKGDSSLSAPQLPKEVSKPTEPYNIDNTKLASGQVAAPIIVNDLNDVYQKYPKSDVGSNIIEAWAKVKPEDKAKIREAMDNDIAGSKEILRQNPEDKKAKHLLKISEMMKVLIAKDFNIKSGEALTPLQAEDQSKR